MDKKRIFDLETLDFRTLSNAEQRRVMAAAMARAHQLRAVTFCALIRAGAGKLIAAATRIRVRHRPKADDPARCDTDRTMRAPHADSRI